jgi:plasmid maintenance system antidote protein VapI
MVNTDDFIKRLEIILDYYNLNASSFADKISVQRSSMSHLLSGRNKPSLDFILKIIDVFPEVDLYWILNGKGKFDSKNSNQKLEIEDKKSTSSTPIISVEEKNTTLNSIQNLFDDPKKVEPILDKNTSNKKTERIIVFYTDGTFKEYNPQ